MTSAARINACRSGGSGADTTLPEWLFSRMATNYSPLVPAVAVIATLSSALIVLVVVALFVGLLHASNVGLLTVRSVGEHLLQLRHR